MAHQANAEGWIGASLLRKEDARHLCGHGMFIADVHVPGVQDVAFVRSQMAHARLRNITKPAQFAGQRVSRLPTSARSTCWKPGRSFPRIATALIRRLPMSGSVTSGKRSQPA